MSEESIDFTKAHVVMVKHKAADDKSSKGDLIDRDLSYAINASRGERFIFTEPKFKELGMQDNSINAVVIEDKVYFQIMNGRSGDMFRGKEKSTNKSKEEKLEGLAELLLKHNHLFLHYKLKHVGDHEGTPFYEMVGVGDKLAERLKLKEKEKSESGVSGTISVPSVSTQTIPDEADNGEKKLAKDDLKAEEKVVDEAALKEDEGILKAEEKKEAKPESAPAEEKKEEIKMEEEI